MGYRSVLAKFSTTSWQQGLKSTFENYFSFLLPKYGIFIRHFNHLSLNYLGGGNSWKFYFFYYNVSLFWYIKPWYILSMVYWINHTADSYNYFMNCNSQICTILSNIFWLRILCKRTFVKSCCHYHNSSNQRIYVLDIYPLTQGDASVEMDLIYVSVSQTYLHLWTIK